MGRVAGDEPGYTFALCRVSYEDAERTPDEILKGGKPGKRRVLTPTDDAIVLPSASTIIGEVLAKPPSAMAWWGYRVALQAVYDMPDGRYDSAEELEEHIKANGGATPNTSLEDAGDRGNQAHEVLECLAAGKNDKAAMIAQDEAKYEGTEYGKAVIDWWIQRVEPCLDTGEITQVLSEVKVWSLDDKYAGTFDLALHWEEFNPGWEILDLKTHKPASGFTKPGKGPAYISDVTQIRAYRKAFEECGLGDTVAQRVIIARDKDYRGKGRWLEDRREVPYEFFRQLRQAYDVRLTFEGGAA
jgi:hypothetical protein